MACSQCVKCLCRLSNEGYIIAYYSKNRNIPLTRADHVRSYRKKNSAVRHEYYSLATKHSSLDKCMLTFTARGRGRGVYTKLRLINEIKTYVTYLIANSKADIYFFSNIEVGTELSNPHLHTQIWSDDLNAVRVVYDKVIDKFGLDAKRCQLSEPQQNHTFYNYVIKDYSKDLNDDELWNLEQTKKRMRKQLGFKLRFYSKSKSKYTQKAYRYFYRAFGVLRGVADKFMDYFFSIFFKKERVFKFSISTSNLVLNLYRINREGVDCFYVSFFLLRDIISFAPSNSPPSVLFSIPCDIITLILISKRITMKKKCSRCKKSKDTALFKPCSKYADGLYSWCIKCKSDYQKGRYKKYPQSKEYSSLSMKKYLHSKKGVVNSIYSAQKRSPISKQLGLPSYTKDELYAWLFSQDLFHVLYNKWVTSGHLKDLKPSVDRKDDYAGYSFNNIQLMTWEENRTKHHKDRKNGINNKASRPVNKLSLDGLFIESYTSMCSAARDVGTCATPIKNCCDKKTGFRTASGYKWEYKK